MSEFDPTFRPPSLLRRGAHSGTVARIRLGADEVCAEMATIRVERDGEFLVFSVVAEDAEGSIGRTRDIPTLAQLADLIYPVLQPVLTAASPTETSTPPVVEIQSRLYPGLQRWGQFLVERWSDLAAPPAEGPGR